MKIKTFIISLFLLVFFHNSILSQEVSISGFYQADLLYDSRPGISISYTQNYNSVFSAELEYGFQYINQYYSRLDYGMPMENNKYDIHAKLFMNNIGLSFLLTVYENDFLNIKIGSKPAIFNVFGNEYVHRTYYEAINDSTFIPKERDYVNPELYFKFAVSKIIKFKLKKIFIPNLSMEINLSHGYIINGSRPTGCVLSPTDFLAPYGRIGVGLSYNFSK